MADYAADPEFDPPPPPEQCKCAGTGWVTVQPSYATHMYPDPSPEVLAHLPADQAAQLWAEVANRRAAAENTVYPCRVHKANLFYRWAGKHFENDHDSGTCAECIEARTGPAARRRSHATVPTRRDTE